MTTVESPPAEAVPGYPVRLDGALDPGLRRWLWLVKWLLLIPHVIVLFFLWVAVAFVTLIAFFAILITARYPRPLFDFTVGVIRWTWRVSFYGYSALGTDRYPPFRLAADPNYPAEFTVPYPQRLSRGLVLVKWWLLAIPQYIVVGAFSGGGWGSEHNGGGWPGLITVLVFFAAVALLFTGRYPRGLFAFVMGLNRWVYRVLAYAILLRDEYPPFRLDQGGTDPGSGLAPSPPVRF
jgi:Domain of unknown function (DUF4389)